MTASANQPATILVADDEPLFLQTTGELLRNAGYACHLAADASEALEILARESVDLVLADLNMPGNLSLELLQQERAQYPEIPLIVVTGMPTLPSAIESVRLGIADYLLKPVKLSNLLHSIQKALRPRQTPAATAAPAPDETTLIGRSKAMRDVTSLIRRIARRDINVLITGESGTGKEIVAREIHRLSGRDPLEVVDCTAIPESLFETLLFGRAADPASESAPEQPGLLSRCHGGTVFLDELGDLPPALQAMLLRVVQDGVFTPPGRHEQLDVDTRFISATNRRLDPAIDEGAFRKDLFYRLAVVHIELPPLRDRGEDVRLLAEHFLAQLRPSNPAVQTISPAVIECFRNYSWPGNVRELRNVLERAVSLTTGPGIRLEDLPASLLQGPLRASSDAPELPGSLPASRVDFMSQVEREYLIRLLTAHHGNVSRCAQEAEMTRQGFHKLLDKHGISADQFRAGKGRR